MNGDVPLSICLSFVSNLAAIGTIPACLYIFFEWRFDDHASKVSLDMFSLMVPLALVIIFTGMGMYVRARKSPEVIWWVSKVSSILCLVFLFGALAVGLLKYKHLLKADWSFYAITLSLQPMGYNQKHIHNKKK